ncbi:hypothetical protein KSP40_PGU003271 [Platanthera guangdongensis]|uniref:Uncharacterized protein n=1 Tax=Platanthera guangdongensis TaxID=2320717 RepID=A0ABR2LKQ6_9ASPA
MTTIVLKFDNSIACLPPKFSLTATPSPSSCPFTASNAIHNSAIVLHCACPFSTNSCRLHNAVFAIGIAASSATTCLSSPLDPFLQLTVPMSAPPLLINSAPLPGLPSPSPVRNLQGPLFSPFIAIFYASAKATRYQEKIIFSNAKEILEALSFEDALLRQPRSWLRSISTTAISTPGHSSFNLRAGHSSGLVVVLVLLLIFAIVHSGSASIRDPCEKLVGERAYRVLFAGVSLPLVVSSVVSTLSSS